MFVQIAIFRNLPIFSFLEPSISSLSFAILSSRSFRLSFTKTKQYAKQTIEHSIPRAKLYIKPKFCLIGPANAFAV